MTPYRRNEIAWHAYCQASGYRDVMRSGSVWPYLWAARRHELADDLCRLLDRIGDIAVPDHGTRAGCIIGPPPRNCDTPVTRNVTPRRALRRT